jgi:magnesium-protoporphyrin O-methyltransferase
MRCCAHCKDASDLFYREKAQNELRKYRKSGPPNKLMRLLIDVLKTLDLQERTLLDVGGGVGMIPLELLEAGVSASTLVEASPAYLDVAEQEARRRGFEDQTAHEYGDFVERAPDLPEADVVTLDRVFCCYPHLEELVEASTSKATRWYGVTYPKERWYNQVIGGLAGVYCWVRDMDFQMHIHTGVEEAIRAKGFAPFCQVHTILWRVGLYGQQDDAAANAG